MLRSVKKLRPKANKLLGYSLNWKRTNKSSNVELGDQIYTLMAKEVFPQAIELFFKIPQFKNLLKNLRKGSLWKTVYLFTDEDHHPPEEIQKIQDLASAFQKVCSLSHYPNYPKNPLTHAKLLSSDIHDSLLLLLKLERFQNKAATSLKKHLFSRAENFFLDLTSLMRDHPKLFLEYHLHHLPKGRVSIEDIEKIHEVQTFLHTLSHGKKNHRHLCHKVLNQMQGQIETVFDSIAKHAPFYLPFAISKVVHAKMEGIQTTKALYLSMQRLFEESRYEIIETKQMTHHQNLKETCAPLHILSKSLASLAKNNELPKAFRIYYHKYFCPLLPAFSNIEHFNSQIGYLLAGMYQTQVSYLLELLSSKPKKMPLPSTKTLQQEVILFLEKYAKVKPELLQVDIKNALTNPHLKELSLEEAKAYIKHTFSYLLPQKKEDTFLELEKESKKILTLLLALYKQLDQDSYLACLLKEKIKSLYLVDVPSFSLTWFLFGEILSILYILESEARKDPTQLIEKFLIELYKYPIFNVLLNKKHTPLPAIFIKLQMTL